MTISKDTLRKSAAAFNIELTDEMLERFDIYARLLIEWSQKMNLTAIKTPEGIVSKHFTDSLALLNFVDLPENAKCIDVGTGAGFPGMAIKIARPDLQVSLLDGTQKRLTFLQAVMDEVGLRAETLHLRGEEAGQMTEYREQFDFATARAVSNLRDLSEYCLPFVKVGGLFAPMKASEVDEEVALAKKAIRLFGGEIDGISSYTVPDCGDRSIIKVKKISHTPPKYPRPSAKIAKNPIQ